jgi:hypothetical protein
LLAAPQKVNVIATFIPTLNGGVNHGSALTSWARRLA